MIVSLLGYMGCGKSSLGTFLAKKMGYAFIDLDDYIEEKSQKKIKQIFSEKGEIFFRKLENDCLEEVLNSNHDLVLSLGGGTPIFFNNIEVINQKSFSVYLYLSPENLASRLIKEIENRPLISHLKNLEDLEDFIKKHLMERNPFYMQAQLILKVKNQSIEELSEKIISKFNTND